MQQFKQILFVFILIAVIFVSGCINMDINQKIKSDGNSEIEIVYDLSAIPEMMMSFDSGLGQQENMSDFEENFTQICTKFYEETEWKNATCRTTDDYKIVMSGEISLKDSPAFKITHSIPFITYEYDVKNIYIILSNASEAQEEEFSDAQLRQTKSIAGLMGMEWKYTLEMPGKITKADVGEIVDNKVIIDMFDLVEKDHVYVESQKLNFLWDIFIIAIIVTVIITLILIFKRRSTI